MVNLNLHVPYQSTRDAMLMPSHFSTAHILKYILNNNSYLCDRIQNSTNSELRNGIESKLKVWHYNCSCVDSNCYIQRWKDEVSVNRPFHSRHLHCRKQCRNTFPFEMCCVVEVQLGEFTISSQVQELMLITLTLWKGLFCVVVICFLGFFDYPQ